MISSNIIWIFLSSTDCLLGSRDNIPKAVAIGMNNGMLPTLLVISMVHITGPKIPHPKK
jgi:sulfite exporter TauE/SafE